ncbi:MAG: winged helix-turn-helix transcriptional regulator [Candidatus Hodarchaeales archaeon]|jgi:predicted transcriptional regulator
MLSDRRIHESSEEQPVKLEKFLLNPRDRQVYHELEKNGPLCRQDLCKRTGLASSTIFDALTCLMIHGIVDRHTQSGRTAGRPRAFFELNE